jgi:cysteine desulfurase
VIEAMTACLGADGAFENPSSTHAGGLRAKALVEAARGKIAALVNASAGHIVFTSGATESNNLALKGAVRAHAGPGRHLVTTRIEHHSVIDTARFLETEGVTLTVLDCDEHGIVEAERVRDALRDDTVIVSVMHVNNEIGVIQDIEAIARECRARGVLLHVDAAQSAGKIPVDLAGWGVDLCSLTAHKMHGPKGIGALYVRRGVRLAPLLHGGGQEQGLRAGTLATHQIVGMGETFGLADPVGEGARLAELRRRLLAGLLAVGDARLNGSAERAAPHVVNVTFGGIDGESLRAALGDIAASAGSACASSNPEPSHVLASLGLSGARAQSSLRFGLGRFTTPEQVDWAVERVTAEVTRLRALARSAPGWCSA